MAVVTVSLDPPYDIVIESHVLARLGGMVRSAVAADRAILVTDANVASTHGRIARQSMEAAGLTVATVELIAKERRKTLETARDVYAAMLDARLDRSSPVVAIGGGITGDVAGFVAATFMRGLPLVQVPTTLLAMVDAAIGGKTGVNYTAGASLLKNMIGAFHQPRIVIVDPQTLTTLESREFRCGLAECIKHAIIADNELFTFLSHNLEKILALDSPLLAELIERSAAIKAAIVSADERESGSRALLNLGHTFGHALESIQQLDLRHGEAVAIGLIAAAQLAVYMKRLDESDARQMESLIERTGLPHRIPSAVSAQELTIAMGYDKKIAQGRHRLILPTSIGSATIVTEVPQEAIEQAWFAVGASYHGR